MTDAKVGKISGDPIKKLIYKLKLVKQVVKKWNKDKFGSVFEQVIGCRNSLADTQKLLYTDPLNEDFIKQEEEGRWKLEATISNEAVALAQKSRVRWLKDQDRYSKYFVQKIKQHRNNNNVTVLHDEGEVITDTTRIKDKFVEYYKSAYANAQLVSCEPEAKYIRNSLVAEEVNRLEDTVSREEVQSIVFSMGPDRAPCPDGFGARFLQQFWSIVGDQFSDAIIHFFDHIETLSRFFILKELLGEKINSNGCLISALKLLGRHAEVQIKRSGEGVNNGGGGGRQ
ncbi:uncharacterized protein LOC132277922 [Cornus florida]|uniref:uncharacterized protein LOC132277922 n=1 Tax=Cornus florida TaxID=4283 RepID=UPI0028986999|nr:uncharacterized protein LOC132277922 [Cornus florida]